LICEIGERQFLVLVVVHYSGTPLFSSKLCSLKGSEEFSSHERRSLWPMLGSHPFLAESSVGSQPTSSTLRGRRGGLRTPKYGQVVRYNTFRKKRFFEIREKCRAAVSFNS
jgi:hypothetical protein